jgi:hypothetical protein
MLSIVQNAFALSSGRDSRYLVPTSAKYCSFVSQTTQLFIGSRNASNRICECTCRFFLSLTLVRNVAFKKAIFWRIAFNGLLLIPRQLPLSPMRVLAVRIEHALEVPV